MDDTHPLRSNVLVMLMSLVPWAVGIPISTAEEAQQVNQKVVTFYAMGDVPYTPTEDALLPKQISEIPDDAEFVVHVGDIKSGKTSCHEAVYEKVAGMLAKSKAPLFIIPGDNEWNDCIDRTPDEAWAYWRNHFLRFDRRWHHRIPVFRQLEREENFSFVQKGVLFVGLNLVGGRIHDPDQWKERHADCITWIDRNLERFGSEVTSMIIFGHAKPAGPHQDFFDPLSDRATLFGKPILYLHGDGHRWIHDRPFAAKNILRVQVDQGGIAPPIKVTVSDVATNPFRFDRRK